MRTNTSENVITFSYIVLIFETIIIIGLLIGKALNVPLFIMCLMGSLIIWVILYSLGKILQHQEIQTDILKKLQTNVYDVKEIDSTNDA